MPYIKFGTGRIQYNKDQSKEALTLCEIIDSQVSYRSPRVVTSKDELDIWFGRDFPQRDWYEELLSSGVKLFLYKPVPGIIREDLEGYMDLEEYTASSEIYPDTGWLPDIGEPGILYLTGSGTEYIWNPTAEMYIDVTNLQQNIRCPENCSEWLNRDTLRLLKTSTAKRYGFEFCHPKYPYNSEYTETLDAQKLLQSMSTGMEGIEDNYETCAWSLDFSGVLDFYAPSSDSAYYFTLPAADSDLNNMIWFQRSDLGNTEISPVGGDFIGGRAVALDLFGASGSRLSRKTVLSRVKEILEDLGYTVTEGDTGIYTVHASKKALNTYFYELPGLLLTENTQTTQNLLSKATQDLRKIEFYSKTIGPDPGGNDIWVSIEEVDYYNFRYRVTVGRYDYTEVHEANLYQDKDIDGEISNLEATINRDSKLVECKVFKDSDKAGLPCGTWYLHRATQTTSTPEMYWTSLGLIEEEDYLPDFLLVPDIEKYRKVSLPANTDWYPEYVDLLEWAETKNCQVLIQNSDLPYTYVQVDSKPEVARENTVYWMSSGNSGEANKYWMLSGNTIQDVSSDREITNPYRNQFLWNYTNDPNNRLLYFYHGMEYNWYDRPGYYIFVRGINQNVFSLDTADILYSQPTTDAFLDEDIEKTLEKYKSNFLVDSGQKYYYKKYFWHPGTGVYNTSGLSRFCIGKLSRSLQNNRWDYLGSHTMYERRTSLTELINSLESHYSGLIRYILVRDIQTSGNSLLIKLDLYVSELLDKSINLSVTLNYNY